ERSAIAPITQIARMSHLLRATVQDWCRPQAALGCELEFMILRGRNARELDRNGALRYASPIGLSTDRSSDHPHPATVPAATRRPCRTDAKRHECRVSAPASTSASVGDSIAEAETA